MESNSRNNQGRFVSGHKGAKPKGAMNKNTREYLLRLDKINNILESNLEDNISSLSKKEQVMLWLELQKIMHIKMSKFTEPEPEKERIEKIVFEVIGEERSQTEIQADPPLPSGSDTATSQTGSAAVDGENVGSPKPFRRASSI